MNFNYRLALKRGFAYTASGLCAKVLCETPRFIAVSLPGEKVLYRKNGFPYCINAKVGDDWDMRLVNSKEECE